MDKEFVPYELAVKLKELGFDEPCVYYVDKDNESYIYNFEIHPDEFIEWCGVNVIPAPTFSQCFRWFRDNYELHAEPIWDNDYVTYWFFCITKVGNIEFDTIDLERVSTYEEAELECLIKLIEIVKTK